MKRFLSLSIALILMLACVSGAVAESKGTIGVIPKSTLYDFYLFVHAGADAAAAEYGYDVYWQGTATDTDDAGQLRIIEDMDIMGVDAIVLSAINSPSTDPKLAQLSIPVISFDDTTQSCLSTITVDHYTAAAAAADYMAEKIEPGKVAVISAVAGTDVIQQRESGFVDRAEELGFEVVGVFHSEGDRERAANIMQDLLVEYPDLVGVFCTNEGSTAGTCMTIRDEDAQELVVVGYDTSDETVHCVYDGYLDAVISQNPYGLGYNSVVAAIEAVEGKTDFDKVTYSDSVLITAENIHDAEIIQVLDPTGEYGYQ